MPFEVRMSQFANRAIFEQEVANHVARMTAFNKEVGKPRPVAHPLIEASVKRVQCEGKPDEYVPDYIIIDDASVPSVPALSLDDRKHQFFALLAQREQEAKFKILPQRKIRLVQLRVQAARAVEEEARTPEQKETIASYDRDVKAWQDIELIAAQAESDIDDLTDDTVERWEPPNFG